jgi:uncharacterized protein (TIRG00374 family)
VKRALQFGLGIAISAVCVWLSMKDVRPGEVWHALRQANYLGFAAVVVTTLFGFWLRAVRWRSLLSTPRPIGLDSLYSATMIGFMANNLLPLRLGEFVRAWALGRREQLSKTTVFATVVVERVVDMLTLLAILGLTLIVHPIGEGTEAGRMTRAGATALVSACLMLTVLVVLLERHPEQVRRLMRPLVQRLPDPVRRQGGVALENFIQGLAVFRDFPRLAWVFLLSFLMFGVIVLGLQASLWALNITVPWYGGLIMLVMTAIGIMMPAAPGYIGTMNLACIAGLALFSVGKEAAVPFSWFYWAGQWLPVSLVGLFYLRREGLTLASLGRVREGGA